MRSKSKACRITGDRRSNRPWYPAASPCFMASSRAVSRRFTTAVALLSSAGAAVTSASVPASTSPQLQRITDTSRGPENFPRSMVRTLTTPCGGVRDATRLYWLRDGSSSPERLRSGGARGGQVEDAAVAPRHAGLVAEDAALAQEAVHASQVVVRNRHQQMMLEVVVDVVGGDQEPLPPARERGARVAEIGRRIEDHGVLGDRADAHHEAVGGEPGGHPEQVERRVAEEDEQAEQDGGRDHDAVERLEAGVEVAPDAAA